MNKKFLRPLVVLALKFKALTSRKSDQIQIGLEFEDKGSKLTCAYRGSQCEQNPLKEYTPEE